VADGGGGRRLHGLCIVLALTLFESRVPVTRVATQTMPAADHAMPLLAPPGGATVGGVRKITLEEVAKHNREHDCWVVVHGRVYDVTAFLPSHPGGRHLLLRYKGAVADEGFDQHHELSVIASNLPPSALVGALAPSPSVGALAPPARPYAELTPAGTSGAMQLVADAEMGAPPLGSKGPTDGPYPVVTPPPASSRTFLTRQRQVAVLGDALFLSHDVVRLRLILPPETPTLGLPVGKHVKLFAPAAEVRAASAAAKWNGRDDPEAGRTEIERKYTPTTSDDDKGYVDLVVKVYAGGVLERFADGGKMSQYLGGLRVGAPVALSGPWGAHEYLGSGRIQTDGHVLTCTKLGMMAGGTGLTPMLQIIAAVLKEPPASAPTMWLLLANQTEDDILVREMLEGLQAQHPTRLHLHYTLDRPPAAWAYSRGFITKEMIAAHLPPPGDETLVLMCGPPPMVQFACRQNLDALAYPGERQISF